MADQSRIQIDVALDDDKVPERITWKATDQVEAGTEAKAFLLAFFDKESRDTLKIDLWTKEMQVFEMDRFFYNTLKSLADTYFRATGNEKLAGAMQQFARYFGEEVEIVPKEDQD
jgi:gliding motility-associated protein GldC